MIVVHITDKALSVVTGIAGVPATVQTALKLEGLRGCVRDGVVVDPSSFESVVGSFWEENQIPKNPIKVVLDSPHFLVRSVQAPVFKRETELNTYLQRELASISRISSPLFTYQVNGTGSEPNTQNLTVTVVESLVVERLVEAFGRFGVKVEAVVSVRDALTKALVANVSRMDSSSNSLSLLAGRDAIEAAMVCQGQFRYSTEQNVFNEYGTDGFSNEVARMVSSIRQFTIAENHEQFDCIYLFTPTSDGMESCARSIASLGIDATIRPVPFDALFSVPVTVSREESERLLPAILALMVPEDGESLVSVLQGKGEKKAVSGFAVLERLRPYAVPLATFAVCTVLVAAMGLWNASLQGKVNDLNAQLNSAAVQEGLALREVAQADSDLASVKLMSAQSLVNGLAQYPELSSSINKRISKCADGLVSYSADAYDAQNGIYVITATSKNEKTINRFVRNLIDDGYFQVNYSGYAFQNDKNMWELSIELALPAGEGE